MGDAYGAGVGFFDTAGTCSGACTVTGSVSEVGLDGRRVPVLEAGEGPALLRNGSKGLHVWNAMNRIRVALPAVGVLLLSALASWRRVAAILQSPRLPFWDIANHGHDGVLLSDALRRLDPVDFLVRVHGMSLWPPVMPLLEISVSARVRPRVLGASIQCFGS